MALVLTIAGSTKSLREGSLRITESTNGRNTMQFQVVSVSGTYRPSLRDEVVLTEGGTRIFGGYIDSAREMGLLAADWGSISHACAAIDYNALADRKIVTETIPSGTLKAALQVLDDYLTDFSVSLDAGQVTGPTLPDLNFQNRTLASCLNEIAALTDYVWEIDYNKVFRMKSPAATAAAYSVTDANRKAIGDISVEPTQEDYANTVVVLGGEGQREVTETFTGDGVTSTWTATYTPVPNPVTGFILCRGGITEAGSFATLSQPAGGGMYTFDPATNILTRAAGAAGVGDSIEFIYTAQFPYVARADTGPSAADVVERIIAYPETFDATVLQSLATTLVARLSATRRVVKYSTLETSPHPGQTQTITIADRNLSTTCLITDVQVVDMGGNRLRRDVTAIEGTVYTGSWTDTIEGWSGGGSASSVSSVSGTFVLNTSGTFVGDVIANASLSSGPFESALRGSHTNPSVFGPAVQLGRTVDDWRWFLVANTLRGSTPGDAAGLEFIAGKDSSSFRRAMALSQADTPVSGEYYLVPSVTGSLTLGAPSGAFGAYSGAARWEAAYLQSGVYERNRAAAMGYWTTATPTLTATAGNWNSATVNRFASMVIGNTMFVEWEIDSANVTAAPNELLITIPGSGTAAATTRTPFQAIDAGGAATTGIARVVASGTVIRLQPTIAGTTAWTTTAGNNTSVRGQISFELA